ncbi:MAG: WYL domain-containing protein [Bacteroidota bacterium]
MNEYGTKHRLLRIMLAILENPNKYTKAMLANRYACDESTIKRDIETLRNAGFVLKCERPNYRYQFVSEGKYKQLKELLHFSEEDQALLYQAIDSLGIHDKKQQRLKHKLTALYDYNRLGHAYLRKPYLSKVDSLTAAKADRLQVLLVEYRSSTSNIISDRVVEPFHISPPDDTLQAFDVDKNELRHFRISRIRKVRLTSTTWQFEKQHVIKRTDPFRIVDNNQEMVHLRMSVGGYNELVERYPLTKAYLEETSEDEIYDFQCKVNHRFLGLTNFILGFHHQ